MRPASRHLPLLLCCLMAAAIAACGGDEPSDNRPGRHGHDTPTDTTGNTTPSDTIHNPTDTTPSDPPRPTITVTAPRGYGYMGQTMQLTAVNGDGHSVAATWTSSRTDLATVDDNGLVTFANTRQDGQTLITAAADGATATLQLDCRQWTVAMHDGIQWAIPDLPSAHVGDTLVLTITDSALNLINDDGFNASSCTWSHNSRNADPDDIVARVYPPDAPNGWCARYVISPTAADGAIINIRATLGAAASSLSIVIRNP